MNRLQNAQSRLLWKVWFNEWRWAFKAGSIILIGLILIYILVQIVIIKKTQITKTVKTETIFDLNDPFSESKVKDYLIQLHVKYPDIAIAQMKLESANGTSKVFREGNNLWGMKYAEHRPTTALGIRNNHAYYSHWRQSCIDYAIWQSFVEDPENISSESEWMSYISKYYSEDNSYRNKILVIMNNGKVR